MKKYTLLFVFVLLALVACAPPAATNAPASTSAPTQVPAAQNTTAPTRAATSAPAATTAPAGNIKLTDGKLVIAIINDQSGVYADLGGKNVVVAVQMAVDDFKAKYGDNALGGPVEVISADHQNKPDVASSKAQEFIDRNNADLILDMPTSSAALAVMQVVGQKKRLYINISGATTELTGKDCNKYTFHYAYDTYMLAAGTGTWVTQNVGKNWYIIYPNYAFGQDMNKSFTASIQAAGGNVLASDPSPFPNPTGDFSSLLLKAPTLKPDVLGAMQAGGDLVNVVKQYNEFKLKDQNVKLAIGLLFDTDIKALGPEAFSGVVYTTPWIWNQDDASKAWADKFKAKTGVRPTFAHAGNYSATMQYLEAIRRAGTDEPDAIVKQLEGYKFSDFFIHNGTIRPEDHYVAHDAFLAQVKAASESKEDFDYSKIIGSLSADQASRPVAQSGCNMPK